MLLLSNWLLDSGISKVCEQSLRWRKPSKHEPELISEESLIMFAKLLSMHIYDWHIRCDILIYILYVHIVCWLCLLLEPVREIVNQGIWQSQCPRSDYNFMLYYAGLVYWDQFPCTTNFPLLILITNSKLCTCTDIFTYIYTYTFVINFSKNKFPYGPLSKNKSTWLLNFQGRLFINHEKHQTYTLNRMCFIECKGRITNVHHEHLNPKIDLTENLKKPPINLMVKTMVSGSKFPANQLTDFCWLYQTLKKIDEWFTRVLVEFHISIVLVPIRIPWTHNMPIVSIINGFFPWFTNEFPSVSHMFSISFPYVFQLSDIFLGFLMIFSWFPYDFQVPLGSRWLECPRSQPLWQVADHANLDSSFDGG